MEVLALPVGITEEVCMLVMDPPGIVPEPAAPLGPVMVEFDKGYGAFVEPVVGDIGTPLENPVPDGG